MRVGLPDASGSWGPAATSMTVRAPRGGSRSISPMRSEAADEPDGKRPSGRHSQGPARQRHGPGRPHQGHARPASPVGRSAHEVMSAVGAQPQRGGAATVHRSVARRSPGPPEFHHPATRRPRGDRASLPASAPGAPMVATTRGSMPTCRRRTRQSRPATASNDSNPVAWTTWTPSCARSCTDQRPPDARTIGDWGRVLSTLANVRHTLETFRPRSSMHRLRRPSATGNPQQRAAAGTSWAGGSGDGSRGRQGAAATRPASRGSSRRTGRRYQRTAWRQLAGSRWAPEIPADLDRARSVHAGVTADLDWLQGGFPGNPTTKAWSTLTGQTSWSCSRDCARTSTASPSCPRCARR